MIVWFMFPGLTHSRSGIQVKKGGTSLNKTSINYNSVVKGLLYQ